MSNEATVPEAGAVRQVGPRQLRALVLATLTEVGLGHLREAMSELLRHQANRMLKDGAVDLAIVWQPLSQDASIKPQQAGEMLMLLGVYLDTQHQMPVSFPPEGALVLKTSPPNLEQLDERLARLIKAVDGDMLASPAPGPSAAPAVHALGAAADTPDPVYPAGAPVGPGQQKDRETERAKKAERAMSSALAQSKARQVPSQGHEGPRTHRSRWALVVALFVLAGGLVGRFVYLQMSQEAQARHRQEAQLAALSAVIPVQAFRVSGTSLFVTLANTEFVGMPTFKQQSLATELLSALHMPRVRTLYLSSGDHRYQLINKDEQATLRQLWPLPAAE